MEELVFHHEGILTLKEEYLKDIRNLKVLEIVADRLHYTYQQAKVTVVHSANQVHFIGVWEIDAVEKQLLMYTKYFEDTEWLVTGNQIGFLGIRGGVLVWCDVAPRQNWVNLEEVYNGETETV